jgi:hypothetical protein
MSSARYLSYDCAHKTLSYSIVTIRELSDVMNMIKSILVQYINKYFPDEFKTISMLTMENPAVVRPLAALCLRQPDVLLAMLREINRRLRDVIDISRGRVLDIIQGRKVKEVSAVDRVKALKSTLDSERLYEAEDRSVLVETQPGNLNFKSSAISDQLSMYHADEDLHHVSPHLKNKLCFDESLAYEKFLPQYKKQYDANKAHTSANLLYYLQVFDREDLVNDIKKDILNNLADSFMQALAFHYLVRPKLHRRRNLVPPLTA